MPLNKHSNVLKFKTFKQGYSNVIPSVASCVRKSLPANIFPAKSAPRLVCKLSGSSCIRTYVYAYMYVCAHGCI